MRSVLHSTMNKMVWFSEDIIAWEQTAKLSQEAIWEHISLFALWAAFCVIPEILEILVLSPSPSLSCQCCCHMKREAFSLDVSLNTTRSVQQARNLPAASTAAQAKELSERAATSFLCSELVVGQAAQNPADQSHLYTKLSSVNHSKQKSIPQTPQHTTSQIIIQNCSVQHLPFTKWDTDPCQGSQVPGKLTPRARLCKDKAPAPCDTAPGRLGTPPCPSQPSLPWLGCGVSPGVQSVPHTPVWLGQTHGSCVFNTDWSPSPLPEPADWWI